MPHDQVPTADGHFFQLQVMQLVDLAFTYDELIMLGLTQH